VGTRKRKVFIPPKKSPPRPQTGVGAPPTGVSINTAALDGRAGLAPGDRVRILGTGLYAGEIAVIEKMAGGVVPAASVRTEAGRARTVRTVDLEPVARASEPARAAEPVHSAAPVHTAEPA
jgi:hypothetical protein